MLRRDIHDEVCRTASIPTSAAFVQAYGSKQLDASLLLIPLVGFLPPDDPRVRGTVEAIERRLSSTASSCATTPNRYRWPAARRRGVSAVQLLARRQPDHARPPDEAQRCSSGCCRCATTSACSSEEYDPNRRRLLGNFPQALSHIALINTANTVKASRAGSKHDN